MGDLVDSYLSWKYPRQTVSESPTADSSEVTITYTINVINIITGESEITISRRPDSISATLDLLAHGYLAKTPTAPEIAISVGTLELFHRLRMRKPSLSAEAFAKVICDMSGVSSLCRMSISPVISSVLSSYHTAV